MFLRKKFYVKKNVKRKKEDGTFHEEFAIKAFRYVVDTNTNSLSEQIKNAAATSLMNKYL